MRNRAFLLPTLFLIVALVGCKDESLIVGGTPPPRVYRTAASLSPSATEVLGSYLHGTTLIGRTASCNYPNPSSNAEIVMSGVKPNYEKIAQLRPEIIVYDDQLFSEADIQKLKDLKIETFALTGDTVEEFTKSLFAIGSKLRGEMLVSEYVDKIHTAIAAASGAPPVKELKVAVLIPGKGTEHMIAGTKSFVADEVRLAQGVPVGPDSNRFETASAESLISLNPDVIISAGVAAPIQDDPRLQQINAIRKKHILAADPDVVLRRGGRVDKFIRGIYGYFATVAHEE